ncbi:hypothetical protein BCON_0812g00010 [Botryotinia convoluta]|uniref:Uncharacterized protein n=1 Tax=Botryotinia convoluta TaxID=54673 RepID=A0A4Z1HFF3_9HELO|nr:hypothetical protein BCON_0812g00010 [Botryotinia convoluta]
MFSPIALTISRTWALVMLLSMSCCICAIPVTSKSLNYTAIAESTEEIRQWIVAGKEANQTDEEYQYQFEVVHEFDTQLSANGSNGTMTQYWQGYHYRETIHQPALDYWNDSYAPFTSFLPTPSLYQPVSFARHNLKSLEAFKTQTHDALYVNDTSKHVFARADSFIALLTPLARLVWNSASLQFEDEAKVQPNVTVHVGLFLADRSDGASHVEIYETLQLRRAYIESVLREDPTLADGLLQFAQSGKSLKIGKQPNDVFDDIYTTGPLEYSNKWQFVAVEDFFFADSISAARLLPKLKLLEKLVWPGSSGSFALATAAKLRFDYDGYI